MSLDAVVLPVAFPDDLLDQDVEYYSETETEYSMDAQRQWEESVKQLTGLVNNVLFPLLGKLIGRRTAHLIWHRFADWYFL